MDLFLMPGVFKDMIFQKADAKQNTWGVDIY